MFSISQLQSSNLVSSFLSFSLTIIRSSAQEHFFDSIDFFGNPPKSYNPRIPMPPQFADSQSRSTDSYVKESISNRSD